MKIWSLRFPTWDMSSGPISLNTGYREEVDADPKEAAPGKRILLSTCLSPVRTIISFLLSEQGIFYKIRVYEIPEASKTSQGRVIQNLIELPKEDKIKAYIIIKNIEDKEFMNSHYILFCTKKGTVKKTLVDEYAKSNISKIRALTINEGDTLIDAQLTDGNSEMVMANKKGYAVRFNEDDVESMGRTAAGVRGMTLAR